MKFTNPKCHRRFNKPKDSFDEMKDHARPVNDLPGIEGIDEPITSPIKS